MIFIAPAKKGIPSDVRRQVALREGATGPGRYTAACSWCGKGGQIAWMNRSWVTFPGLHLDHFIPEQRGGQAIAENIVLACQWCNCSRGGTGRAPRRSGGIA